jgi:tetratricopeptide (TPR) repeat protein
LNFLANRPEVARRSFVEAREADPEVGWGHLMEPMIRLGSLAMERGMPGFSLSLEGVRLDRRSLEDTAKIRELRKGFRESVEAALTPGPSGRDRLWGAELSEGFAETMRLLSGIQGRDEGAESVASAALDCPEFFWIEEELLAVRARARFMLGRYKDALRDQKIFLERCPESAPGLHKTANIARAVAYSKRRNHEDIAPVLDEALKYANRAVELAPRNGDMRTTRATILRNIAADRSERGIEADDLLRQALEDLQTVLDRDGRHVSALINLSDTWITMAEACEKRGDDGTKHVDAGLEAVRKAESVDAAHPALLANRATLEWMKAKGEMKYRGGRPEPWLVRAVESLEKSLKLGPRSVDALVALGGVLRDLGNVKRAQRRDPEECYRKSLACFESALEILPLSVTALIGRGMVRKSRGDFLRSKRMDPKELYLAAAEDFAKAAARWKHPSVHNNLGTAYWSLATLVRARKQDPREYFGKAIEAYEKAIARKADYWIALFNHGLSCQGMASALIKDGENGVPHLRKSAASFKRVAELSPNHWVSLASLGGVLEKLGNFEEGLDASRKGAQLLSNPPKPLVDQIARLVKVAAAPPWKRELLAARELYGSGDPEAALIRCRKLLAQGFRDFDEIGNSPELAPLRDLPGFEELLAEYEGK